MAWSSPSGGSISAGDVATPTWANTYVRDNLLAISTLTSYTPTLVQSGAVTKTVTYASYITYGNVCIAWGRLACTGAGTGNNAITIGLPVASAQLTSVIGMGEIYDASGTLNNVGVAKVGASSSSFVVERDASTAAVGISPNFALASGDEIRFQVFYMV